MLVYPCIPTKRAGAYPGGGIFGGKPPSIFLENTNIKVMIRKDIQKSHEGSNTPPKSWIRSCKGQHCCVELRTFVT